MTQVVIDFGAPFLIIGVIPYLLAFHVIPWARRLK